MNKTHELRIRQTFGEHLLSIGQEKGFSQEAQALACEAKRTYIGSIKRGERNINLVKKIARAFGIAPKVLMQ